MPTRAKPEPVDRPRLATGIAGFDALADGGLPRAGLTVIRGGPGTGKSVFALQALVHAAHRGESAIYVSFDEGSASAAETAMSFEWPLSVREARRIRFVEGGHHGDLTHPEAFDLGAMLGHLEAHVQATRASFVAFEGLEAQLALRLAPEAQHRETMRLRRWVRETGLAGLVTVREPRAQPAAIPGSAAAMLEFSADCVVRLRAGVRHGLLERTLRIVKYRAASHTGGEVPMLIDSQGLQVGFAAPAPPERSAAGRIRSGVQGLDALLGGGFLRGGTVLVSGPVGTAKTTLAAAFAAAAAARGERTVMVLMNEDASHAQHRLRALGIDLEQPCRAGLLHLQTLRSSLQSPGAQLVRLVELIREREVRHLVLDPASALDGPAHPYRARYAMAERLVEIAGSRGITSFCTSIGDPGGAAVPAPLVGLSNRADTWIGLANVVRRGKQAQRVSILRSRGSHVAHAAGELRCAENGVELVTLPEADQ